MAYKPTAWDYIFKNKNKSSLFYLTEIIQQLKDKHLLLGCVLLKGNVKSEASV